ncbi:hypothetical protein BV25DRAFT_1821605 [Artomyces pyxidatus]|uniref:Uncharacterized protein n=1 Tax=Artomyces pyxidatus TaxID=48021 RepID=A0ACB8TCM6_9AGAM|nr:hypothetical protein BV25DRAFT_1821605 [Artomyces pyxidatus]
MSAVYRLGPFWNGYSGLKKVVVFGDSYSYVGYHSQAPVPTPAKPFGLPYPGTPLTEPGLPNWVGYLITTYANGRANMVVYDYAVRGDTVPGVARQVAEEFLPSVGKRPSWARWTPSDTLFVTWIGTDDCRLMYTNEVTEVKAIISNLFAVQEQLYAAGARNFLFIDVPPIHRSPVGPTDGYDFSVRFKIWNAELRNSLATFTATHADCTVMLFSAWDIFNRVLDNPAAYGFNPQDVRRMNGSIWFDHIHPTSKFHDIIARSIAQMLAAQPPAAA